MQFFMKAMLPFFSLLGERALSLVPHNIWREYLHFLLADTEAPKHTFLKEIKPVFSIIKKAVPFDAFFYEHGMHYIGLSSKDADMATKGVGVHFNFNSALMSGLIEFLERYSLRFEHATESLRTYPGKEENIRFIYPSKRNANKAAFKWVRCKNFSGDDVYLPAQLIFWDYTFGDEQLLAEPGITGAAAATTKEGAITYGIYEIVERDAFLLNWLQKKTPPQLDLTGTVDYEVQQIINLVQKEGLQISVLDITSDISIPTVMVLLTQNKAPMVSRGFSANLDIFKAIKKAFYEAWGNYILNMHLVRKPRQHANSPFEERYRLWVEKESFAHLDFLFGGPTKKNEQEHKKGHIKDEFFSITALLGRDREMYYYQSSHPLLAKLGLHAIKVNIPSLLPFYFDEKNAHISHSHPRISGKVKNTFPHPFA